MFHPWYPREKIPDPENYLCFVWFLGLVLFYFFLEFAQTFLDTNLVLLSFIHFPIDKNQQINHSLIPILSFFRIFFLTFPEEENPRFTGSILFSISIQDVIIFSKFPKNVIGVT